MEMSQGNFLCSYLKHTKISFFFLLYKIREQEGRISLAWGEGHWYQWEEVGKGCGRVNILQILITHVCKWKNDTCCNCQLPQ
jgi:hypothetical protein